MFNPISILCKIIKFWLFVSLCYNICMQLFNLGLVFLDLIPHFYVETPCKEEFYVSAVYYVSVNRFYHRIFLFPCFWPSGKNSDSQWWQREEKNLQRADICLFRFHLFFPVVDNNNLSLIDCIDCLLTGGLFLFLSSVSL